MTKQLRHTTTTHKINAEAKPFSTFEIITGQGSCTYEVVATVQHIGTQLAQGHYIAYVKQGNNWILCDDERIIPLADETRDPVRNAYLMILRFTEEDCPDSSPGHF